MSSSPFFFSECLWISVCISRTIARHMAGRVWPMGVIVRALTASEAEQRAAPHRAPVAENRLTPLLMYAAIGAPLLAPGCLRVIPEGAIDGVLVFVGVEGIVVTSLWQRLWLLVTSADAFPDELAALAPNRVRAYTLVQLWLLACCWLINVSPAGLCVSFLIVSLVPFRERVMTRLFSDLELKVLDAESGAAPPPLENEQTFS